MRKLIDVVCPTGHVARDVWFDTVCPPCCRCGQPTQRAWLSAPSITPNGTRPERNTERPAAPPRVDTKKIAEDVKFEVEQKWLRYSDEKIAEQHISREINEAAGIADAQGNEKPVPTPAPITFAKPTPAECGL